MQLELYEKQYKQFGWCNVNGEIPEGSNRILVNTEEELRSAINSNAYIIINSDIHLQSTIEIRNIEILTIVSNGFSVFCKIGGFSFIDCKDLIVHNLKFFGPGSIDVDGDDLITISNCERVWINHCKFEDGLDGNLDIKNLSKYLTISYCKFSYTEKSTNHQFSNLIGSSDEDGNDDCYQITFAFCWWSKGCVQRMPRIRFGKVHVINCYYNYDSSSGIQIAHNSNTIVERCFFNWVINPIDISKQTGNSCVKIENNKFNNCTHNKNSIYEDGVYYTNDTKIFEFPSNYSIESVSESDVENYLKNFLK